MSKILEIAKEVLRIEGNEILRQVDLLDKDFENCVNLIYKNVGKVIITGVGKSGHIGAKIAATLASTGTPSFFIHPTEALHGDLGMIQSNDIIMAISFSGESEELIKILPHIKRNGIKIVGVTRNKFSSLGKFSDFIIKTDILKEACPLGAAPTTSTTLTLAIGDALAISLMKLRKFTANDFANFHPGGSLGKKMYTKVNDIMVRNLPVVRKDVSLKVAIDMMTHGKLGAVLLTNSDNSLYAILSDGDLRRALMSDEFNKDKQCEIYATKNPKTINNCGMLAVEALKIIEKFKIQLLVVVDNKNCPIGIVHIHDLAKLGL